MVERVGLVGAGIMGAGIAEVAAKAGIDVVLRSRSQGAADDAIATLEKSLLKQVEKGKLDDGDRIAALARVHTVTELDGLRGCDLVIESVVEDLATKQELLAQL